MTEATNELFTALALAQAEVLSTVRNVVGQVGTRRNKYADLAACWDACRAPLAKHGLCVIQIPRAEGANVTVETILGHKSGQSISGSLTMVATDATPQRIGSAITYARRYSLASIVGISVEDDDGAAASTPRQQDRHEPEPQPVPAGIHPDNPRVMASGREIPEELRLPFARIDTHKNNIAPAFLQLEKALIEKGGANGVQAYTRVITAFRSVIPKGKESLADIKEVLLDLWDALQTVEHPLGDLVTADPVSKNGVAA